MPPKMDFIRARIKLTGLTRTLVLSNRAKSVLSVAALGVYLLSFMPLYHVIGAQAGIIGALPVLVVTAFFGLRKGLVASLAYLPVNTVLMNLAGEVGIDASIRGGLGFGVAVLFFATLVIGYLDELSRKLRAEIKSRVQAQEEIRRLNETLEQRVRDKTKSLSMANKALRDEIAEGNHVRSELKEAEDFATTVIQSVGEGIVVLDRELRHLVWNKSMENITGVAPEEAIGKAAQELSPQIGEMDLERLARSALAGEHVKSEVTHYRSPLTGKTAWVISTFGPHRNTAGDIVGAVGAIRDVTDGKLARDRIRLQLDRLQALRQIKFATSASLDMNVTFDVLLDQVTTKLDVDAAAILLHDSGTKRLTFGRARGFQTDALRHTQLQIGEGYAGRAALERRVIHVPNLGEEARSFCRSPLFGEEGFVGYCAVPLIAQGEMKGVLELFSRRQGDCDTEWLAFLETLGYDAAVAIENTGMFQDLQRANADLRQAYDRTLEGWVGMLDLRDEETEGHTRRVTAFTTQLAEAMGIRGEELTNVWRGALLHDIGKMAIPDSILRKPGPLTEEEWVVMRKHPRYGYDLIYPIEFLRPATDIPYCHHEKVDGTGYPRGLKGEGISLAARLFAIVDVWDALNSDRPYRKAWPRERILAHIKSQSGKHFDPKLVEMFLDLEPAFSDFLEESVAGSNELVMVDA